MEQPLKIIHNYKVRNRLINGIFLISIIFILICTKICFKSGNIVYKWGFLPFYITCSISIALMIIYSCLIIKENLSINYLLTRKCNPNLYFMVSMEINKPKGEMKSLLELNTSFYNGAFEEAISIGKKLLFSKNKYIVKYALNILPEAYFFTENLDALELMKDEIIKNKLSEKQQIIDIYIELLKNNFFKSEQLLKEFLLKKIVKNEKKYQKKHTLLCIKAYYLYSLIYISKGEYNKAKENIDFIIKNGGEVFYVKKAKELAEKNYK